MPETVLAAAPTNPDPPEKNPTAGASRTRENNFPLLLARGNTLSPGSLVRLPTTAGPSPLLPIR